MISVVIVDDHVLARLGMKRLLEGEDAKDIKVVGEAESGEAAITLVKDTKPDIVLMDIKMPGMGGLDATRRLVRVNPKIKIIVVTVFGDAPFPVRLVRAGASGYITKDTCAEELVTAIRKVMGGQIYITPEIAQKMALRQVTDASKSPFAKLSERELQVMYMVTRGIKVNEIAKKLYLSPKTVNTYRYRLYEKLNVHNDVELTHLALRYGLLEGEGYSEK
ncbi:UvrY/SirA/GacA family response regulator transcription factor [Rickettsiella massiliensis]|uniref:UvrY/SirA/GacA family response regulator transcription factor n=1 Tax=Rickettsiella massiliensis TaxID=676517 RepID=UPI00029A8B2B|nr:UvrY/SirA/GacA family response regulator transcription factor [Rickettsiella massiliensis]